MAGQASAPLGTAQWTRQTKGRLTRRERCSFVAQAARFQAAALPEQLAALLRLRPGGGGGDVVRLADLAPPATALTREAEDRAAALPAYLCDHSHRTYLWGACLAALDGLRYDREALYVAALLHDAGLAQEHNRDECFTLTGIDHAVAAAAAAGCAGAELASVAADAIALHVNPIVKVERGVEAHLLAAGAALDVVGRHHRRLDIATVRAIVDRHPRQGFKASFRSAWRDEAERVPQGRAAVLQRLGFGLAIRLAPFDE